MVRPHTTLRFSEDDKRVIARLQELTGLDTVTAVIRLALNEALRAREQPKKKR